jgi:hypothetical protein
MAASLLLYKMAASLLLYKMAAIKVQKAKTTSKKICTRQCEIVLIRTLLTTFFGWPDRTLPTVEMAEICGGKDRCIRRKAVVAEKSAVPKRENPRRRTIVCL